MKKIVLNGDNDEERGHFLTNHDMKSNLYKNMMAGGRGGDSIGDDHNLCHALELLWSE